MVIGDALIFLHHYTMSDDEANIRQHDDNAAEEEANDWSALNRQFQTLTVNDEALPKRSDKYFDPDGSDTQKSKLDIAQDQMYLALLNVRGHHIKQLLVAVWFPNEGRALIPHAKGSFFKDIGLATSYTCKKRLLPVWLNPIEAVYLVERGSLIMYLADDSFVQFMESEDEEFDYSTLTNITMSHLYSLAFGRDSSLLDKYQVYALLKRLGYLVLDHRHTTAQYDDWQALQNVPPTKNSWSYLTGPFVTIGALLKRSVLSTLNTHFFNYTQMFNSLELIPSYSAFDSLKTPFPVDPRFQMAFNVWKPSPSFSKRLPPTPDFQVAVVNVAKVPFPPLSAVQNMWNQLTFDYEGGEKKSQPKPTKTSKLQAPTKKELSHQRRLERESKMNPEKLQRIKYLKLRDSKFKGGVTGRSIVVAAIDTGIINFSVFNEAEFKLKSSFATKELDLVEKRQSHGIVWSERQDL